MGFTESLPAAPDRTRSSLRQAMFIIQGTGLQMGSSSSLKVSMRRQDGICGCCLYSATASRFPFSRRSLMNSKANSLPPGDGSPIARTKRENLRFTSGLSQLRGESGRFPRMVALSRNGPDGKELFYLASDGNLMAVPVKAEATFEGGVPKALFPTMFGGQFGGGVERYRVTPDGQQFLINTLPEGQGSSAPITVVLNWGAVLKK
jgi:hypothetical protein